MTHGRTELLAALAQQMTSAAGSVPGGWDAFAVVADITALGVRVTGFRYLDQSPGVPMLMGDDLIETIAAVRSASPGPAGEMFDVYVVRLIRATGEVIDQAFSAVDGAGYQVTAANVARVGELLRPGPADLPPLPSDPKPLPSVPPPLPSDPPPLDPVPVESPPVALAQSSESTEPVEPVEAREANVASGPGEARGAVEPVGAVETVAIAPAPPDPIYAVITADLLGSDDLSHDDWTSYGAAASFQPTHVETVGFRYLDGVARPTFVGGALHRNLRALQQSRPNPDGELAGAALLRLIAPDAPAQLRLIYGPDAFHIRWDGIEEVIATRLWPVPSADGPGVVIAARPDGDLLSAPALLDRACADVAASLRSRDGWVSFCLAADVEGDRDASFIYASDGVPTRFVLPLSPLADLTELREQTARTDGSRWSAAVMRSWIGSDRVDVSFYGPEGIDYYLGQGPDAAGAVMRPPATAPAERPSMPWPATGGFLDANALQRQVSAAVSAAPELSRADWDTVAVVIVFTGPVPAATALRYPGAGPGIVTAIPDLGPIGKFRRSTPRPDGSPWDVCVLRGRRGAEWFDAQFEAGEPAQALRATAATIQGVSDRIHP